ncbi:MAG: hypothetical protein JNK67_23050, partial [Alphaproteobacteria bacterium]|nr:hypothetical protein [Alphaproteobacteria bacterium]
MTSLATWDGAVAQSRSDCYTPTFTDGMPVQFVWRPAGGGDIASAGNYFPMCFARKEPPPGDPIGGPPIYFTPSAIDTIVIFDRNKSGFGAPGEEPGPVVGTITSGGGTFAGLGILAFDSPTAGRSDITFSVGGILNLTDGFSGLGIRDAGGTSNLRINGSAIATPVVSLSGTDVQGSIAVSSEKPTDGFTISSPDVRISNKVAAWDVFIGFGAGSTGTLALQPDSTLALTGSAQLMFVGFGGAGTLDVGAGALVQSGDLLAGTQAGSSGTISVHDGGRIEANLAPTARMEIARHGAADVTIGPGSDIKVETEIQIGSAAGGDGFIRVDAGGKLTTKTLGLRIGGIDQGTGEGGTGKLVINGGTVELGGRALIGASEGGKGSVEITGGTMTLKERIVIGHAGEGELKLSGDGKLTIATPLDGEGLRIGRWSTGKGTVEFSGPDARVEGLGNNVVVGLLGDGTLKITDGFKLDLGLGKLTLGQEVGAKGTLRVDGSGSELGSQTLVIGDKGTGDVAVTAGGTLKTAGAVRLGEGAGPAGRISTVTVDGTGSRWEIGDGTADAALTLGGASEGRLTIRGGGVVELKASGTGGGTLRIAEDAGTRGVLRIEGAGSRLDIAGAGGQLRIGAGGEATLEIVNGATFALPIAGAGARPILGELASAKATLLVEGGGAKATFGGDGSGKSLIVGDAGRGDVAVKRDATLEINGLLSLGAQASGVGTMSIDGPGAVLNVTQTGVVIGDRGTGSISVLNGGKAEFRAGLGGLLAYLETTLGQQTDSSGTLAVSGAGSAIDLGRLRVGVDGAATVSVGSGGRLTVHGDLHVGETGEAPVKVSVAGSDSKLTAEKMVVGSPGAFSIPTVEISDHGQLHTTGDVEIGPATIGSGKVIVTANGLWRADGALLQVAAGAHGTGELDINGGKVIAKRIDASGTGLKIQAKGELEATALNVNEPGGFGESVVTVTGESGLTVVGGVHVKGGGGGGRLLIEGKAQGSVADLRLDEGGRVDVKGEGSGARVAAGIVFDGGGTLAVSDRATVKAGTISTIGAGLVLVSSGAELRSDGDMTLRRASIASGGALHAGGGLRVEPAPGVVDVAGSGTTLTANVFEIAAGARVNFAGSSTAGIRSAAVNQGILDMRGGIMVVGTYAAVPGELVDGTVVVGLDGTFSGSGTVLGSLFRVV